MINEKLVKEQLQHYERTGQWRRRITSKLDPPLLLYYIDGLREVRDGTVTGLIHQHDIKGDVKVYSDIRTGLSIGTSLGRDSTSKFLDVVQEKMEDIAKHDVIHVAWKYYANEPRVFLGNTHDEVIEQIRKWRYPL